MKSELEPNLKNSTIKTTSNQRGISTRATQSHGGTEIQTKDPVPTLGALKSPKTSHTGSRKKEKSPSLFHLTVVRVVARRS
jgi:Ulp1 family protease